MLATCLTHNVTSPIFLIVEIFDSCKKLRSRILQWRQIYLKKWHFLIQYSSTLWWLIHMWPAAKWNEKDSFWNGKGEQRGSSSCSISLSNLSFGGTHWSSGILIYLSVVLMQMKLNGWFSATFIGNLWLRNI